MLLGGEREEEKKKKETGKIVSIQRRLFFPREKGYFRLLTIMRGRDSFVEISIRGWEIRPATLTNDISALSKKCRFSSQRVLLRSPPFGRTILIANMYNDQCRSSPARTDDLESKFASDEIKKIDFECFRHVSVPNV